MDQNNIQKSDIQKLKDRLIKQIKRQRKVRGLTQREIALHLDITERTYQSIENGKVKLEKLDYYLKEIIKI